MFLSASSVDVCATSPLESDVAYGELFSPLVYVIGVNPLLPTPLNIISPKTMFTLKLFMRELHNPLKQHSHLHNKHRVLKVFHFLPRAKLDTLISQAHSSAFFFCKPIRASR
jgi:hypothetical protein